MPQNALAAVTPSETPLLGVGRVQAVHNDHCMVAGPMGMVKARRGLGCLLQPQRGDTVLVVLTLDTSYVLQVLERADADAGCLSLPPQTTVDMSPRAMNTATPEQAALLHFLTPDLRIVADQRVTVHSQELTASAEQLTLSGTRLCFQGKTLLQRFTSIHTVASHVFQYAQRLLGLYGKQIQRVRDVFELRAGRTTLTAEQGFTLRAQHADITTKDAVKIDGKHIHLG